VVLANLFGTRRQTLNLRAILPGEVEPRHCLGRPAGGMQSFQKGVLLLIQRARVTGNIDPAHKVAGFVFPLSLDDAMRRPVPLAGPNKVSHHDPRKHHLPRLWYEDPLLAAQTIENELEIRLLRKPGEGLGALVAPMVVAGLGVVLEPVKGVSAAPLVRLNFPQYLCCLSPSAQRL